MNNVLFYFLEKSHKIFFITNGFLWTLFILYSKDNFYNRILEKSKILI